jgi:DtxR family transcriptional regulator, Mn-dependent transcriptional regulator
MKKLSPRLEDYLEALTVLSKDTQVVRVKELSDYLSVARPTANAAVKALVKYGLVKHQRYSYIVLTDTGKTLGNEILAKHSLLVHFLKDILGIDNDISEKDACEIEHCLSDVSIDRMIRFIEFLSKTPIGTSSPVEGFKDYLKEGHDVL